MDESVGINISANNTASAEFAKVAADARKAEKEFKELGKGTADASDGVQKLANVLGGGWLSSAAFQAKELTEGVMKLKDSMGQLNQASALAKVGMVGLAAVGGFMIGKEIGEAVLQTEKWNSELEKTLALRDKLNQQQMQGIVAQQSEFMASLKGKNNEELTALVEEELERIKKQQADITASINRQWNQVKESEGNTAGIFGRTNQLEENRLTLEGIVEEQKKRDALQKQRLELEAMVSDAAKEERAQKEAVIEAEKAATEEKQKQAELERQAAIDERERLSRKQKHWQEEKQFWAARTRADKEGINNAVDRQKQEMQALYDGLKEAQGIKIEGPQSNQAVESRFLSGVSSKFNAEQQQMQVMEKSVKVQEAQKKILEKNTELLKGIGDKLGLTQLILGS